MPQPDPRGETLRVFRSRTVTVRTELAAFAEALEAKLKKTDYKAHWSTVSTTWLLNRLHGEVNELEEAFDHSSTRIREECVDVANFAMMIYDNLSNKDE